MARNNDLVVTAGLNIEASVAQIEKDLKQVDDRLSADHALKIIANVDLGKTTQRINSQLATISKNLNLNIGKVDVGTNVTNIVSEIHNALSGTNTDFKINVNENALDDMKNSLHGIGLEIEKDIDDAKGIQKIVDYFKELDIQVTKVKPKFEETSDSVKKLVSLTVQGINTKTGAVVNIVDQIDGVDDKVGKTTTTITQNLAKVEQENKKIENSAKAAQLAYNDFLKLKGQTDVYSKQYAGEDSLKTQLADIQNLVNAFDKTQPLEKQRESIILIDNELKKLKVDIDAIKGSTDKNAGSIEDWHRKQNLLLQDYDILAAKIKKANLDINQVATRDGVNYNEIFNNLMGGDITNSGDLSKARDAVAAIRKEFQLLNAQMVSDLPQNVIENLIQGMNKADSQIKVLTVDYEKLENPSQELIQSFEKLRSLAGNFDFSTDFEGETKESIEKKIKDYTQIKVALSNTQSALKAFQKEEKKAFQEDNRLANLQNRIKRLTADVNAYGEANERATKSMRQMSNGKTFAVEWSRITTEMAKGADLTDRELKDLSADMAVFRKEAQAAGLAGESTFGKFANSFKVMSSYITANMVFNFVKRQLHEMVQEVTAVDTAMVELHKVTKATDEQFEAFARSAGQTGRELGASVSDVINATATFARLGESLPDAEELGKVATLYKNVGDGIDITTASEDIISTMRAFKIEASDAITIVDKLNEVGNSFAISSGGIGEALKRSASALAVANNDISQSIALITTANTIAQDPTAVGQGIKTVSLRLRSTKTEIEEMGEDAEGAAENVSKLREQMLALTGVDIQLDDDTYKSTYQILLEISKVWGRLSDLSRSSVLEQLFGKRQANIGAAILENGDLLERVYKTSEGSMGSAMREQEEYAKSIQYSIDTLKAAYQDFADSVINSDFVKNLLGTAQSFLEVLTKIIDKFGTLPTILTGIATIGGIKGVGIFGDLDNEFKVTTERIKDFKQILSYDFGSLYKKNNISLAHISPEELQTLQTYVNTLGVVENRTASYNDILKDSSDLVKRQATYFTSLYESYRRGEISLNQYQTATQNLALTQKTAATTSKALSLALNTIVNVGTMVLINLAIQGISKLADKLIVTKEELAEMRQETLNSLDSLKQGIESLSDSNQEVERLLSNYKELVSSTNDTSEAKDQLIEIQRQLIDKFGEEADNLDLLNDKYDTTIEKIKSLSDAEEAEWRRQHAAEIKRAEDIGRLNVSTDMLANQREYISHSGDTRSLYKPTSVVTPNKDLVAELYLIEDINRNARWAAESIEGIYASRESVFNNKDAIILTGTIEEARQQLGRLIDEYDHLDNADVSTLATLTARYKALGQAIEDVATWTNQVKISEAVENTSSSFGTIATPVLSQLTEIQTETDAIRDKWFENLDEIQKGSLKTIDTMKSALQTIAGDGLLSSDEFWALAKIDTERVLDGAKLVGNQFKVSEEQLIQLKDTYIKKQIVTIKAENADLAVKKQQTDELIRQAELEVQALGRRGLSNSAYRTEFEKANKQFRQLKQYSKEYGDSIARNNILIQQLNGSLGNTVDYQKALSDRQKKLNDEITYQKALLSDRQKKLNDEITQLNNEADNLLKAQEYVIDQRIKARENEKKALENEKKLLEEQLDVLEQQQSELEDMIENYKSIAGVVEDELGKSIENLKKQQEAEENAVQAKIDALKESREQQDEENSLLEKELELKEKLANLDKAKSTKVRTFSSARGWHFDVDREAVANAEEEVRAAQKSYDDAVADKAYKDQEKALEQEKDAIAKNYEVEIKAYEDYIQQYKDILEEETVAENERLAEQILWADWREKISKRDVELLGKFRNEYRSHNNTLKTLVNTELAMTKASIKAKDAEIKAKQEQIDAWNLYKTNVQQAAQDAKNANEDYMKYVNEVLIPDEANSFASRELNLLAFKEKYTGYMDEIASKQAELDSVADSLTNLQDIANGFDLSDLNSNLERMTDQFGNALLTVDEFENNLERITDQFGNASLAVNEFENNLERMTDQFGNALLTAEEFERMWQDTYEKQKQLGIINSASAVYVMGSHSKGGVADYTGLAMLHGTKQKSETIFNANDSAKLYDMIHNTPNLMADMVSKAVKISRPTIASNSTTNNPIFNIQRMVINGVQNPKEFTEAFNKNIEAYWKTKLTENRVK